ncbi:MAG: VanZ family protein [Coriobacteriia bacterium]|nr:VanZ family protein [Coriobacteriia bacterium]
MGERRMTTRVAWMASLLWMGVIFGFSSLPGSSVPVGEYGSFGHFSGYLVLGALYFVALGGRRRGWRAVALAVLLASAYGVTDELHQSLVPGRMPDPADWATDTAGALTGALIALGVARWLPADRRAADPESTGRTPQ